MKSLEKHIYELSGFTMPQYKICITEFNQKNIPRILSDNFFIDANIIENDFGLYLNEWLKITHKVLWQIDAENSILYLFSNSLNRISDEFSVDLKIEKELALKGLECIVLALAEAHFFIEKFVFNIEGNWLLKRRNEEPVDLIRYFIFWAAWQKIKNNSIAADCFEHYLDSYAKDIMQDNDGLYSEEEMVSSFIQCFYRNINEKKVFQQVLQKEIFF